MKTGNLKRKISELLERAFKDPEKYQLALEALGHKKVEDATREQLDAAYEILKVYEGPAAQISQRELAHQERCQEQRARLDRHWAEMSLHPEDVALEKRVFVAVQKVGKLGIAAVCAELSDFDSVIVTVIKGWSYLNIPDLLGVEPQDLVKGYQDLVRAKIEREITFRRQEATLRDVAAMLFWLPRIQQAWARQNES